MTDIIQWTATLTGIVAAIMVAGKFGERISGWGFLIFTISAIGWILFACLKGEPPLAIQNVVLLLIDLFGVYRHLIMRAAKAS
jgi:uncharacterized membrane protein